ncbi:hypothetical protein X777_04694 [Ooceraea biroi]|uniref:SREBP regulating gene protein n=1 Tax=Ooceraea biroi TaxID=2015173 RepID=A0A026X1B4_OOCBI|nr:hypothetical protein X777_04694 [Ooceraea biroi]
MSSYTSLIRLIRRRLVLGLIFALSLTYCAFSLLRNEKAGPLNLDGDGSDLDEFEPMMNDNNEDVDNVFAEELRASGKPPWQMEVLDPAVNDNAESLDALNLNESDVSTYSCRNSVQGRGLIVDEHGVVCTRHEVLSNGCCRLEQKQVPKNEQASSAVRKERYSCKTCNSRGCCTIYEYCVSCCLHPGRPTQQINRKSALSSSAKAQKDGGKIDGRNPDRFQICLAACRTSSSSLRHENTYRDPLAKHCYIRQPSKSHQKHRRNINSLNNNGDSRAVVVTSSSVVMLLASLPSECHPSPEHRVYHSSNESRINVDCPAPILTLTQHPSSAS